MRRPDWRRSRRGRNRCSESPCRRRGCHSTRRWAAHPFAGTAGVRFARRPAPRLPKRQQRPPPSVYPVCSCRCSSAAPSSATWVVGAPITLPAVELAAPELQIETVPAIRQGAAFDVGQRQKHFVTRPTPDLSQRRAQCRRRLLDIHAERQWRVVIPLRLGRRRYHGRHRHGPDRGRGEQHPLDGCAAHCGTSGACTGTCAEASLPSGVHPPPSAWNRLEAASSLVSRTCASVFSAMSSVCWVCSTVIRLTVPARNWVSETSKALRELVTASICSRSCSVACDSATSAFSTSAKADSTALR